MRMECEVSSQMAYCEVKYEEYEGHIECLDQRGKYQGN